MMTKHSPIPSSKNHHHLHHPQSEEEEEADKNVNQIFIENVAWNMNNHSSTTSHSRRKDYVQELDNNADTRGHVLRGIEFIHLSVGCHSWPLGVWLWCCARSQLSGNRFRRYGPLSFLPQPLYRLLWSWWLWEMILLTEAQTKWTTTTRGKEWSNVDVWWWGIAFEFSDKEWQMKNLDLSLFILSSVKDAQEFNRWPWIIGIYAELFT